ncbi:MAG: flavodoxin family protein [Spirochaetales bacterium]|nr:MAG: flavodoxin family protein [Spirochaetales bacterium]
MNTMIYYYTMTGQCEHLAKKIASRLDCEAERIDESRKRLSRGFLRFLKGKRLGLAMTNLGSDPEEVISLYGVELGE